MAHKGRSIVEYNFICLKDAWADVFTNISTSHPSTMILESQAPSSKMASNSGNTPKPKPLEV